MSKELNPNDVKMINKKVSLRKTHRMAGTTKEEHLDILQQEIDRYQKQVELLKLKNTYK